MELPAAFLSVAPPLSSVGFPALFGEGMGPLLGGLGALVAVFAALAAMAVLSRKHRFSFFWGFLAALFSGAAMLLCVASSSVGMLLAKPAGDPQETVEAFFDALIARDYTQACSYLSGCSGLGLEGSLEDPAGQLMLEALRDSYSYQLYGACTVNQLTARQEVQFTYLNLPAIAPDVEEETMTVLNELVEARPKSELYDENNQYLPQVPQEAYVTAVGRVLESPKAYYTTAGLQLQLEYTNGSWYLIPSDSLLKAITGGAA